MLKLQVNIASSVSASFVNFHILTFLLHIPATLVQCIPPVQPADVVRMPSGGSCLAVPAEVQHTPIHCMRELSITISLMLSILIPVCNK